MKRGDLVLVAPGGDYAKPRPGLVVQSDHFEGTGGISVLLITGTLVDAPLIRIAVEPTPGNGLKKPSQVMIDKVMTVKRSSIRGTIGRLQPDTMMAVTRSLALFLGIA
jgi:mRNA interferase MazF